MENPSQQQERAFLVGVETRSQGRAARKKSASLTRGAQAARDHAASAGASSSSSSFSSSLPADSPDLQPDFTSPHFTSEDSLDEMRTLATSAGAQIAGEFTQRKDRPDPATLIGKGKLEEIAGAAASVSADVNSWGCWESVTTNTRVAGCLLRPAVESNSAASAKFSPRR